MAEDVCFGPPPWPPPILTTEQVRHIASQGWLPLELPDDLLASLRELQSATRDFFLRSDDEKRNLYPSSRGTECGFYEVPGEKQYLTLRHNLHHDTTLECHAGNFWRKVTSFLHRILCDLNRAGGYDLGAWDHVLESSHMLPKSASDLDMVTTLLRLFKYEPTTGIASEHVDIGLLTLCIGGGRGLQVLDRSVEPPQWIDATGPIVLIGDMTRALLRNQVRAGRHRVVGNPDGRYSTVFALRPHLKGTTDLAMWGGKSVVDTREFYIKIKGSKHNINATHDVREKQRQKQRKNGESLAGGIG
ncbi:hypothetical protein LTR62_002517 [Meristemomyces frigidus]|uniref:Fe2OG dioxygenase domain-containing protein n=1 Tax=Meristemomyces frigidus TaxID=1508187 RepID=A0AAN7TKH5_9PEZI|nr:hypothetical protein LTR62_002517 [Meristemomyces frigidus]